MNSRVRTLAYISFTLWMGVEAVANLGDALSSLDQATSILIEKLNIAPNLHQVVFWVILVLFVPILGNIVIRITQHEDFHKRDQIQDQEKQVSANELIIQHRRQKRIQEFPWKLFDSIGEAVSTKPWWFITLFLTLTFLGIFTLQLPISFAIAFGVFALITMAISLAIFINSIVEYRHTKSKALLETSALFAVSGIAVFTGFIAFQIDTIAPMVKPMLITVNSSSESEPPPHIDPPIPQENGQTLVETLKDMFKFKNAEDASGTIFWLFVILGAIAGGLGTSSLMGAVLGAVGGGIIGVTLGSIAGFAIEIGNTIPKAIFPN